MAWPSLYNLDAGQFDRRTPAASDRPSIVLVHDAFHAPSHFDSLVRELRETQYRVLLPRLPSSSSIHQGNVFEADQQAIIDLCRPEIEAGRNIVLVLHGYAGLPGPIAAEMLNRYAIVRPGSGFVVRIVFLAAIVANEGECVLDVIRPEWLIRENGMLGVRRPQQVFFQDCSAEKIRTAVSLIKPQIADSFRTRVTSSGWSKIPCLYVVCELDQAISSTYQNTFLRRLQAVNRGTTVVNLQSGHAPFLSRTRDTAVLIIGNGNGQ